MRIRSIKPEFWRSDDITALDWEARLLFIGLWSYVDDNGVGKDRLADIVADLFAGDLETQASETFARVSRGLQTLSDKKRVTRYVADGKPYLHITNWARHQRIDKPNKARYPAPTSTNARVSRQSRETPAPGTGEQGNRGTGDLAVVTNSSQSQTVTREVDNEGLTRIMEATKGTKTHARQCVEFVLAKTTADIKNPTNYVLAAIRQEPDAFRYHRGHPKTAEEMCPEHVGEWIDACRPCAADRLAAS